MPGRTGHPDKIADQILTNIARLEVANEFQGHTTNYYAREQIADECGIEFSDKEWSDNVWRFADKDGDDYLSDYGIEPLPPLPREYARWADRLLRDKGLRR